MPTLHLRQGPIRISMHDAPLTGTRSGAHETPTRSTTRALFAAGAERWDGSQPLRDMPEGYQPPSQLLLQALGAARPYRVPHG